MSLAKQLLYGLVYKLSPIIKRRIAFSSLNGQYSDSPKAISIFIHQEYPEYEMVWLVKDDTPKDIPDYAKTVRIHTMKANYYSGSSKIVVDNVYAENAVTIYNYDKKATIRAKVYLWLHRKRKQLVFTTWHGTPIKKMGIDQVDSKVTDFLCNKTEMILGDQYTINILKRLTFGRMEMHLLGTARNDVLFDYDHSQYIKELLKIKNKKIILFAPTFRSGNYDNMNIYVERSGINQINNMDFEKLFSSLNKRFGGEWVFICRFHYHVAERINWPEIDRKTKGRVINGNILQDMADYLSCADVLLSDISSCMFDFALTRRPCFILFPDKEQFENIERGLYIQLETLPFPFAINCDELFRNIEKFDESIYKERVNSLINTYGFVDNGHSSKTVSKFIMEKALRQ